jgi:hypothetical protein
MDIEPTKLPGYDRSSVRDPIFSYPFIRCPQKFKDRLEIARKHLGRALEPYSYSDPEWNSDVDLKEISRWAVSLKSPWDLPEQFPKAKEPQLSDIQKSESDQVTPSPPAVQPPDLAASTFTSKSNTKQGDKVWIPIAQKYARQFIEERAKKGSYPNQNVIGDHISKRFRDEGILSVTGKVPTGGYIKRYALYGVRAR